MALKLCNRNGHRQNFWLFCELLRYEPEDHIFFCNFYHNLYIFWLQYNHRTIGEVKYHINEVLSPLVLQTWTWKTRFCEFVILWSWCHEHLKPKIGTWKKFCEFVNWWSYVINTSVYKIPHKRIPKPPCEKWTWIKIRETMLWVSQMLLTSDEPELSWLEP